MSHTSPDAPDAPTQRSLCFCRHLRSRRSCHMMDASTINHPSPDRSVASLAGERCSAGRVERSPEQAETSLRSLSGRLRSPGEPRPNGPFAVKDEIGKDRSRSGTGREKKKKKFFACMGEAGETLRAASRLTAGARPAREFLPTFPRASDYSSASTGQTWSGVVGTAGQASEEGRGLGTQPPRPISDALIPNAPAKVGGLPRPVGPAFSSCQGCFSFVCHYRTLAMTDHLGND